MDVSGLDLAAQRRAAQHTFPGGFSSFCAFRRRAVIYDIYDGDLTEVVELQASATAKPNVMLRDGRFVQETHNWLSLTSPSRPTIRRCPS
jgi:hypothetical protein